MTKSVVCTCLVGLAAVAGPALGQNLVTNGSFEAPAYSGGIHWPVPVTGWTIGPDTGFEVWTNVGAAADGVQFIELDVTTCDTISQTLSTVSGRRYRVQYAYSARPGIADNRVEARWDGQLISSASANGSSLTQPSWTFHTAEVTATGTSAALTFANVDSCDGVGSFLDDVSVTEIEAVPMLGGAGLAVLAALIAVFAGLALWVRSLRP
jgi:hypothetical protein